MPPSPPAEKTSARQDKARQASTGDGAGDGSRIYLESHPLERIPFMCERSAHAVRNFYILADLKCADRQH
jgi:hypothetical protein